MLLNFHWVYKIYLSIQIKKYATFSDKIKHQYQNIKKMKLMKLIYYK